MNINQELTLNLSADGIPPRLHMVQGDANTRTVVATLWDGAQPYTVPAASAVMVRFRKPDGTGGLYDTTESGAQVTVSGNTVTAPVATQMLAVSGVVQAQVDIYGTATGKAAEKLATFRFAVEVAPSVYPDAEIISSDYFNIIAADIGKAVEAAARAEAAQAAASAAQQGAETARDDAVNAKTAAESAKTAAVAAQKESEAAQTKAEAAQTAAGQFAAAAQTAKDGAETAQSGAQAAQSAAESAKADAQAAQTGAETARTGAETAKGAAEDSAEDAEAWAVGQRNGTDVPSTDPAYHNNAKYYKDQAQTIAGGEFVSYGAPQTLTAEQQAQARDNINAPAPYEAGDNISITGRIITTKAFPCNPKITDNWYWGNPVDQRGGMIPKNTSVKAYYDVECTNYAGPVNYYPSLIRESNGNFRYDTSDTAHYYIKAEDTMRGYGAPGYTIDRWKIYASGTIVLSDGHIILTEVVDFGQQIELYRVPVDSPVTFSVLTDTGLVWSTHKFAGHTNETWYENLGNGITLNMIYNWSGTGTVLVALQTQAANIRAVGLELGTQQTLCHKEYGEWVLNEIPDFGTGLLKCQRYFVRKNLIYAAGYIPFANTAFVGFALPVPLRTTPVLTVRNNGVLAFAQQGISPSAIAVAALDQNEVFLNCTLSGGIAGEPCVLHDAAIDFSADL